MRNCTSKIRLSSVAAGVLFAVVLSGCARGLTIGADLEPGDTETVVVVAHCGFDTLEIDVNEQAWSSDELPQDNAGNPIEPAWQPSDDGFYELELTLIDKQTLSVTVPGSGVSHIYTPNPNYPGCA